MIRLATEEDLEDLETLSYDFWKTSSFTGQQYNAERVITTLSGVINQDDNESILLVSQEEDIKGYLLGTSTLSLFSGDKAAYEVAYFTYPRCADWYRLIQAYLYWAKKVGCRVAHFGSINPRLTKILTKRLDFVSIETTLQKEL